MHANTLGCLVWPQRLLLLSLLLQLGFPECSVFQSFVARIEQSVPVIAQDQLLLVSTGIPTFNHTKHASCHGESAGDDRKTRDNLVRHLETTNMQSAHRTKKLAE
ncbi:hypothetical protein Ae201684P_010626 [Aphanomyces euteiches]|uniref:Secreted protein n=1 Tax=Aphanomyces euteiches TaxID=100861 RepID=A0A6G0WB46_9STRA|nr:hypothetical protein Ae201684_016878 [Aphanomyces euteiches]KAH9076691.1 hypothetical protein Ae201684P_010626 [Aphanomyces euteiches]